MARLNNCFAAQQAVRTTLLAPTQASGSWIGNKPEVTQYGPPQQLLRRTASSADHLAGAHFGLPTVYGPTEDDADHLFHKPPRPPETTL